MGRSWIALVAAAAATVVFGVGVAQATFQPTVLYQPPVLKALDYELHNSQENIVVERHGRYAFALRNTPTSMANHAESDPGCGYIDAGVACPAAGIGRLVIQLGAMNDTGSVDLGRYTHRVKQKIVGGTGLDELTGSSGRQRLVGGEDNDILRGGPGRDVLLGGPGTDTCIGGPGRDLLRGCE